MQNIFTVKML